MTRHGVGVQREQWQALTRRMAQLGGMITVAEAREAGLGPTEISWAVKSGDLVRVRRGVLSSPALPITAARAQQAAVLAAGAGAVLSHLGAAGRHGFPRVEPGAIEISVPRRRAARLEGVTAHIAPDLGPSDVTVVGGVACTTMARTLVDLSGLVHEDVLRRMLAHVERAQRPRGLAEVDAALSRVSPKRRPDVAPLRGLIDRMLPGGSLDLTPRFLAAFEVAGIGRPALEVPVTWGGRVFILDAGFLPEQVDVEFDDDWSHATAAGSQADKERDRLARRAGWEVERVTPETDLDRFVEHLGWLLERRRRRSA